MWVSSTRGLGNHWSLDPKVARDFAGTAYQMPDGDFAFSVVFTAEVDPRREDVLPNNTYLGFEVEVSLPEGTPLVVTEVSWNLGQGWQTHRLSLPMRRVATSWRPLHTDDMAHFERQHDAVIVTDRAGRNARFEVYIRGQVQMRLPTLGEAKEWVAERYGIDVDSWRRILMPKEEAVHYWFGPTDEFTDPTVIYVADLGVDAGLGEMVGWGSGIE